VFWRRQLKFPLICKIKIKQNNKQIKLAMKEINQTNRQRPSKAKNIALWMLQGLTAAAFLMAGFAKLSSQPIMVEMFDKIGLGQWFRYLTGGIEITSAILLLVPKLTPVGAGLLVCTMSGAVITHLVKIGGSPVPAIVLGCFAAIILWGRFDSLKTLAGRSPARTNDPVKT
jgi:putative oxidoreductase